MDYAEHLQKIQELLAAHCQHIRKVTNSMLPEQPDGFMDALIAFEKKVVEICPEDIRVQPQEYAKIGWCAEDVQSLFDEDDEDRPTVEEAKAWLEDNENWIRNYLTEQGFESLKIMYNQKEWRAEAN